MTVFLRGSNHSNRSSQPSSQRPTRPVRGGGVGGGIRWVYYGVALLLVLVVVIYILPSRSSSSTTTTSQQQQQLQQHGYLRRRKGTLKATKPTIVSPLSPRRVPDTNIFYLLPPETKTIQGMLFFFHGCQHTGGADFFLLPEDRIVAYEAVYRHSLIAVGFTSSDRVSGCWGNADVPRVQQQIETLLAHLQLVLSTRTIQHDHAVSQLPKYGMGASSGAAFVLQNAATLKITRVAAYIPPRGTLDQLSQSQLPPTILVHMPRDAHNAEAIDQWTKAQQIHDDAEFTVLTVPPHAFTTTRCQERLPELPPDTCSSLIEQAKAASTNDPMMDEKGHILKSYVVTDAWSKLLATLSLDETSASGNSSTTVPDGVSDKSFSGHSWKWAAVQEELQVAHGRHEMTAEHCTQVLNFLQGHE